MSYKLNEEWLKDNPQGLVQMSSLNVSFDLSTESGIKALSKNKKALEMLCKYKVKYVFCDKEDCCQKPNNKVKCTKNGVKEKAVKKAKQVSAKASEKE